MSGLSSTSTKGFWLCVITPERFARDSLNKLGYIDDIAPVIITKDFFYCFLIEILP